MLYFTADWHLGHEAIIDLCSRPFPRMKYMKKALIRNYKGIVTPKDTCCFLGDIFWTKNKPEIETILNTLPGKKILVLGNHDHLSPFDYQELGFYQAVTWAEVGDWLLVHDPAIAGCLTDKKFLCGHVHKLFKKHGNVINVGVDVWDFKPVSLDVLESLCITEKK